MQSFDYTGKDNLDIMSFAVNYNEFLTSLIEKNAPETGCLMDFGAGTGFFAQRISREGRNILCVEPDRQQAAEIGTKGFNAFSSSSELNDQVIDFAYSLNVLEHIEDDAGAIREIYRVLKPGSSCFIYVPAMPILYSAMDEKVKHFRRYTQRELRNKLSNAGFHVLACEYADFLGVLATLVYKLVGSKTGDVSQSGLIAYDRFAFPISKAIDTFTHRVAGKNVLAVARKPV